VASGGQLFEHGKRTKCPRFIAGMLGGFELCDVAHESETERVVSDYGYFTPIRRDDATIFGTIDCDFILNAKG
jgi:hypothetical protein